MFRLPVLFIAACLCIGSPDLRASADEAGDIQRTATAIETLSGKIDTIVATAYANEAKHLRIRDHVIAEAQSAIAAGDSEGHGMAIERLGAWRDEIATLTTDTEETLAKLPKASAIADLGAPILARRDRLADDKSEKSLKVRKLSRQLSTLKRLEDWSLRTERTGRTLLVLLGRWKHDMDLRNVTMPDYPQQAAAPEPVATLQADGLGLSARENEHIARIRKLRPGFADTLAHKLAAIKTAPGRSEQLSATIQAVLAQRQIATRIGAAKQAETSQAINSTLIDMQKLYVPSSGAGPGISWWESERAKIRAAALKEDTDKLTTGSISGAPPKPATPATITRAPPRVAPVRRRAPAHTRPPAPAFDSGYTLGDCTTAAARC